MGSRPFDTDTMFDTALAAAGLTQAASPLDSTNSVDLKAADIDEESAGIIQIKFPGNGSAGSATLQIIVQDSADDSSFATVLTSEAFAKGTPLNDIRIALPLTSLRRYVQLQYVVGTADFNAGALTAGLVK